MQFSLLILYLGPIPWLAAMDDPYEVRMRLQKEGFIDKRFDDLLKKILRTMKRDDKLRYLCCWIGDLETISRFNDGRKKLSNFLKFHLFNFHFVVLLIFKDLGRFIIQICPTYNDERCSRHMLIKINIYCQYIILTI